MSIQPRPPLTRWFYNTLNRQRKKKKISPEPFGTYYEFGVGWGETLYAYFDALGRFCNDFKMDLNDFNIFTFDSFEGLPENTNPADKHIGWEKGSMAFDLNEIKKRISNHPIGKNVKNIHFNKGFFSESLTTSLQKKLSKFPPGIVTVDVDYYSSTKDVLVWLRPILMSGALFYFDDIWSFHGNPNYGQLKAIHEFNAEKDGFLTPFRNMGLADQSYIYSNKVFEY